MTNLKTITVSACTGLAELSSGKQDIIVYPNPTNSTLSIKTEETIESATVYNLLGSVVLEETNKSFSVEQLPAGVYTLQIKTANGTGTVRFVKE
ncbi:MAG: T9SS type A sorting domain-containing protein [Sphingobacteriaceae bacterium]|nr:T9SS type A sorting domain-containing protein [Sphingobacteriaceae bacterium]